MNLMAVICVVVFWAIAIVLYNIITQEPCDSDNVKDEDEELKGIIDRLKKRRN